MSTTAFDDQFGEATEKHVAILRQNVADLEQEVRRQQERANKALSEARADLQSWIDSRNEWMERAIAAEAKLKEAMEQEPVAWLSAENYKRICPGLGKTVAIKMNKVKPDDVPLYAATFHAAPAPAVPEEWPAMLRTGRFIRREAWNPEAFIWFRPGDEKNHSTVMLYTHGKVHAGWIGLHCDHHARDWVYCDDKARALLQSAPAGKPNAKPWAQVLADTEHLQADLILCKGSIALGTGCGKCARCNVEIVQIYERGESIPEKYKHAEPDRFSATDSGV